MASESSEPRIGLRLARAGATALAYALLARLALAVAPWGGPIHDFWPAAGLALAAVLCWGLPAGLGAFLGVLGAWLGVGESLPVAVGQASAALLSAWAGAALLQRRKFDPLLPGLRDEVWLLLLGAGAAPLLSASLGVGVMALAGRIAAPAATVGWIHAWMGDCAGVALVTPFLLLWRRLPRWLAERGGEFAIVLCATFLAGQIVYLGWISPSFAFAGAAWIFPMVAWTAVRFGPSGTALLVLFTVAHALAIVASGEGDFPAEATPDGLLNLWIDALSLAAVGMLLALSVAERERDAAALRSSEERLRKLSVAVEQSPVSIVITDRAGLIEYVNPAFTQVSGYEAQDVIGRNPRILQSGQTPAGTYRELWDSLARGQVWRGEFVNQRKDGSRYYETASIAALRRADGSVSHYVAVKEDTTNLKLAIERLVASEERLRMAKTAAGLGLFDLDLRGGPASWDERMRELWGLPAGREASLAAFSAGLHPDDRGAALEGLARAREPDGGGAYHGEFRVLDAGDGRERHVAADGQVYFADGQAVRVVGMVRDITEAKRMQREIQGRRSEMEQLIHQQVAAQTAAAIAHELNQPLVALSAYSEAALQMLEADSQDRARMERALRGSVQQAQRAGRTLHELLDFLHQGEAAREALDLNALVREAVAIAEESGYGAAHPALELQADLPPVLANRLQIQKVLVNLLRNSMEALQAKVGGPGDIHISVRTDQARNMAMVTVRDSGPGITPEAADRIFDPFFTTKDTGIGLGLAISRALVEAHGGQLWADLQAGPGATFRFVLPFAP